MALLLRALTIFSMVIMSLAMDAPTSAPSCAAVVGQLAYCVPYIANSPAGAPSDACCQGVKAIAALANTKQDRVAICNCIKAAVVQLGSRVVPGRIAELPNKCGVPMNMPPIDKNYDCSLVPMEI